MKYILISAQNGEHSIDKVIHWLLNSKINVIRINEDDNIEVVNVEIKPNAGSTFAIKINDKVIKSEDIAAFWYRRGSLMFNNIDFLSVNETHKIDPYRLIHYHLNKYYEREWEHTMEYIYFLIIENKISCINTFFDLHTNKLINLELAKKHGLRIPESIISNDLEKINNFLNSYKIIITKPVRFPGHLIRSNDLGISFGQKTNVLTFEEFAQITKNNAFFQPTLFQEYIEKEFEIRVFYIKGKTFSMAIFSQNNEKTKIDFRDYDREKPNRNVPFILPVHIERSLSSLMQELKYDTGSIDLIYNEGMFTFLEINTMGHFDWLSKNCNYYLEKKISLELIDYYYGN